MMAMGIKLNPDAEKVAAVRKALKENDGYCPCAVVKNEDTKCICKDFREQIAQGFTGKCHCGLYVTDINVGHKCTDSDDCSACEHCYLDGGYNECAVDGIKPN